MARRSNGTIGAALFRCAAPHPPVDFERLCQLLELEALLGRPAAFRIRLKRALRDVQDVDARP